MDANRLDLTNAIRKPENQLNRNRDKLKLDNRKDPLTRALVEKAIELKKTCGLGIAAKFMLEKRISSPIIFRVLVESSARTAPEITPVPEMLRAQE